MKVLSFSMKKLLLSPAIVVAFLFSSSPAHAVNPILQPQSVTTNLESALTFDVTRLIDQSGLVNSYDASMNHF